MTRRYRYDLMIALVCLLVCAGIPAGWFAAFDNALRDLRFHVTAQPASGAVIIVDIDAESLDEYGPLPWPRARIAALAERIGEAGASVVVLGVPLYLSGDEAGDRRLAEVLASDRFNIRPIAQRVQRARDDGRAYGIEWPQQIFLDAARPVLVADMPAPDGRIHAYDTVSQTRYGPVASAGAVMAGLDETSAERTFLIDYAIDPATIPSYSAREVLRGGAALRHFAGARVYISISTQNSANRAVPTPRGLIATASVQALAAETLIQGRSLTAIGPVPLMGFILVLGAAMAGLRTRLTIGGGLVGGLIGGAAVEVAAMGLQSYTGLLLDTAPIHIMGMGSLIVSVISELEGRKDSISSASRERDSMQRILTRIVADNFDGVVVVDRALRIRAASRLAEDLIAPDLTGQSIDHVLPAPFQEAIRSVFANSSMESTAEVAITGRDGAPRLTEFVVTLSGNSEDVREGSPTVACLTFRDVTDRRQVQERLAYLATHDATTGAASRTLLRQITESLLDTPEKRRRGVNILMVAPSRLKTVNDTLGHDYGDMLLGQIVSRLMETDAACVARLEGNAFALLRAGTLTDEEGRAYADDILALLTEPYDLGGHHALIGCNAGMTDSRRSGYTPDTLIAHANMALSVATDLPGDNWAMFAADMDRRIKIKQEMEIALRAALAREEFSVHYQPQVQLDTGRIIGVEALTRWRHPELGDVSPSMFIAAAEETGLILELGRWVLRTACKEVASWPHDVTLSVNVSPMQFEYGNVVADVRAALAASGLEPRRLVIEITESLLITETSRFTRQLETLRREGVQVALDDFGTGYSSLSYLGRLPVDKIKIDQSFVRGLPEDKEATAIVRAVLMLSESLCKDVIAEGIETEDQAWMLRIAGCRIGQGYFFGKPGKASELLMRFSTDDSDRMPGLTGKVS